MSLPFNSEECERYSRQLSLPQIGVEGQKRLKQSCIALIGIGGIGCPTALYLAAAGIGRLILIDHDEVTLSNLHRQILFHTQDLHRLKVVTAKERLLALNPHLHIDIHPQPFPNEEALNLIQHADLVIDGSDNYATRYHVNLACVHAKKPLLSMSVYGWSGQLGFYNTLLGPCYACVYPQAPPEYLIPNCQNSGILGVMPGILALQGVQEALKYCLGLPVQHDRLTIYHALSYQLEHYPIIKKSDCKICGTHPAHHPSSHAQEKIRCEITTVRPTEKTATENSMKYNPNTPPTVPEIDVHTLAQIQCNQQPHLLVDVREDWERAICKIPGSMAMPFSRFENECRSLSPEHPLILHCRTGGRSACATKILQDLGYTQVHNLQGGILAWIDHIDPTQPKY